RLTPLLLCRVSLREGEPAADRSTRTGPEGQKGEAMQNRTEEERRMRGTEGGPGGREQPEPAPGGETGAAEEKPAEQDDGEPLEESGGPEEADGQAERIAGLERALLDARCRLAAFAAGVSPELVGDAVTLAVQAAREEGEATEEAVAAALEQV